MNYVNFQFRFFLAVVFAFHFANYLLHHYFVHLVFRVPRMIVILHFYLNQKYQVQYDFFLNNIFFNSKLTNFTLIKTNL